MVGVFLYCLLQDVPAFSGTESVLQQDCSVQGQGPRVVTQQLSRATRYCHGLSVAVHGGVALHQALGWLGVVRVE